MIQCYYLSFYSLLGLIILSSEGKLHEQILKGSNWKACLKIESQMIKVYAFKENKKEGSEERPPT
jgi:hypothetical protein